MKFTPAGPKRYGHQKRALRRIIETKGVCGLLMDPGTGKTAPTLDYLSLLAMKSSQVVGGVPEIRALVISPKAAVDTWVLQAEKYVHGDVNVWAEALGGSIIQKAETLISRGPEPYKPKGVSRAKDRRQLPHRALNADRAEMTYVRGGSDIPLGPTDVVDGGKPRLVLLSTNLDTLSSRSRYGSGTVADLLVKAVSKFKPDVIIVDESHKIKGVGSNTSRLAARLAGLTKRRIILTGTVMPHSPMDVFAQWRFLQPTAFGPIVGGERTRATFARFQRRYGVMGGFMGREVVSYQNLDELQDIMADNSIVVKKEDADIDLPEMTDVEVPVVLSPKEQKAYDTMKRDLQTSLASGVLATAPNKLTQMMRLRQITAGHLPDSNGVVQTVGTSKIDTIKSLVHDTLEGESRVVIFAVFRHEVQALADGIRRKGTEVLVIDGRTPQDERLRLRQKFGSSDPARLVLIAQVKTISLSVNELVTANHAIFATLSQQRDDLVQARDRLNRIGQERPCTFWYVLARGTVDEVVLHAHQNRTNLESAVLAHIRDLNDGAPTSAPPRAHITA